MMTGASFDSTWENGAPVSPTLQVLEVRNRKNPERPSMGFFLVERIEQTRACDRYATADNTINIIYREISDDGYPRDPARGEFSGSYHAHVNTVSITAGSLTGGMVVINPPSLQGHGLGTYLMNEVVRWAKRWPDATVHTINLLEGQAREENRERRNRFYEQFGLKFEYASAERKSGISLPIPAKDLVLTDRWKQNISEHNLMEFLASTLYRKRMAEDELVHRTRAVKELFAEQRRREARPLRWAMMQHMHNILWGAATIVVATLVWSKYFK
ncbi:MULTISPECIES: GNAT family N-acetyltransferase [Duganella]|uniref:GNAT family N-acetyltransferase n=2 Tax=Duganella TaxID=75654 RepID=A0A845GSC4_9BURK|nr:MULTISPECIES: GNAT family N-acetyltransferase [Duganella]MYM80788.1 GNAT family N-acetyltransferase [Duganella lactea]MYM96108.1 GNAT family N-acetyltransferase [Duganella vulcania]